MIDMNQVLSNIHRKFRCCLFITNIGHNNESWALIHPLSIRAILFENITDFMKVILISILN